jgi:hypothetical protein
MLPSKQRNGFAPPTTRILPRLYGRGSKGHCPGFRDLGTGYDASQHPSLHAVGWPK